MNMNKCKSVLILALLVATGVFAVAVNVPIRSDDAWKPYRCIYVGDGFVGATNDCSYVPIGSYIKLESKGGAWTFHEVTITTLAHDWFGVGHVAYMDYAVENSTGAISAFHN